MPQSGPRLGLWSVGTGGAAMTLESGMCSGLGSAGSSFPSPAQQQLLLGVDTVTSPSPESVAAIAFGHLGGKNCQYPLEQAAGACENRHYGVFRCESFGESTAVVKALEACG